MYIPSSLYRKDQDIICPYTGEAYSYLDEEELKSLTPEQASKTIELLPQRFFKHPRVFTTPNGEIKIYGIKD